MVTMHCPYAGQVPADAVRVTSRTAKTLEFSTFVSCIPRPVSSYFALEFRARARFTPEHGLLCGIVLVRSSSICTTENFYGFMADVRKVRQWELKLNRTASCSRRAHLPALFCTSQPPAPVYGKQRPRWVGLAAHCTSKLVLGTALANTRRGGTMRPRTRRVSRVHGRVCAVGSPALVSD